MRRGPVHTLAGLSLAAEHRRGHGALYDGLNIGQIEVTRLRWSLAALPLAAWPDGRIRRRRLGSRAVHSTVLSIRSERARVRKRRERRS